MKQNWSIYSINTLLGIVLRIYLGKSPGCPGPQLAAVDILCILCIPQPSPATTHSSRSAPPPSYNITAPDAVTSSHRPARLASQLGFYILLLLDIQKYLPTKWWRVVQSVISTHWNGFVETRSTRPIDAKLWRKLCLWIMVNIKLSLYQTPLYQRSKIFQIFWNLL